jgi:hypothetical protein
MMNRNIRAKLSAVALVGAVIVTGGAATANALSGDTVTASHAAVPIQAKLLPDPCAWDAMPAPPSLELTAFRPSTPSSEKGIACPIERNS